MLTDGIAGLMSLDTEDKVLGNALNLCMAISKTSSGCIIRQTEEDMWKINETHHNIYIPSDQISNVFREGTSHINHEMTCLLPPELRGKVNTVIPINVGGAIHAALLFHNDNNTRAFPLLSLFLSSVLSRLNILKEIEGMKINAAGLAHEIRNPLVSIKTLAQLLPERYDDQEFRYQFTNIAINEIFVEATPISGPARVMSVRSDSRTRVDSQAVIDEV